MYINLKKYNSKVLIDDEFKKPQAFHEVPVSVSGGLGLYISFIIFSSYREPFKFDNIDGLFL